jgi:cholesterol transport system auxiliary component
VSRERAGIGLPRRRLLRIGAGAPLLALAACQLPGQGPPPRQFRLTPKTTFPEDLPKVRWSLVVDRPTIDPSIDTVRIARTSGVEVQYYAGAAWVDRPSGMIEPAIIQSFQNSGAIDVVASRGADVRPDFMLQTHIAAFQAQPQKDASAPPEARVVISARLMTMPRRVVVGTTEIGTGVPAAAPDLPAIAAALDGALGEVLKRLVEWTLTTGQKARKVG